MKTSNFSTRLLVIAASLGIGVFILLFESLCPYSTGWLEKVDTTLTGKAFSFNESITHYEPESKELSVYPLTLDPKRGNRVQEIQITNDPERIFESSPPSPLDYAVILQQLHDTGYKNLVIGVPLAWDELANNAEEDFDLSLAALNNKLSLFGS